MKAKPFRLAHISDPHFGTVAPKKAQALRSALKELEVDLVALSGDVTQRARRDQFIEARQFCESLKPLQVVSTPGNHDIPLFNLAARALLPYTGFVNTFGFPKSAQLQFESVEVMTLNSASRFRHVQGKISKNDLARLETYSKESQFRIAIFHHPMDCAKPVDEKNLLVNATKALTKLEDSRVDLVLGGHVHDPLVRLSSCRYPTQSRRPFVIAVAGTCLSSRTRSGAPNSFNYFEVETSGNEVQLTWKRYDLSVECHFIPVCESQFRRRGRDQWFEIN